MTEAQNLYDGEPAQREIIVADELIGRRVVHEYTQTNAAEPERVFPLLCPVREAEWAPGWQYRLIYSQSGLAEKGCVFATPNEDGSESTWVITRYEPAQFRVEFAWVNPGLVAATIEIALQGAGETTRAHIRYTYTGLSERGNEIVAAYDAAFWRAKMNGWEQAINHYLRTGTLQRSHPRA